MKESFKIVALIFWIALMSVLYTAVLMLPLILVLKGMSILMQAVK